MSTQKKGRWSLLALAMCLYGLFLSMTLSGPARTHADNTPINPIVFSNTIDQTASIIEYWTPKRMASALSADIPTLDKEIAIPRTTHQPGIGLKTGSRHTLPIPNPTPRADPVHPLYPQMGKIFFSNDGRDWVCSGTALVSQNHSLVDTAGHCVADDKHFVSNWIFCPMYNGEGSCHFYVAKLLATNKLWFDHSDHPSGWFASDFGMAIVTPGVSGQKLTDACGGVIGLANIDYNQKSYLALGYPAAPPFNGRTQQRCGSAVAQTDENEGLPAPLGIMCDMTGGSSGGGWLIDINGQLYLNGHTSYGYKSEPGVLYSPYFGPTWLDLYQATQNITV